MMLTAQSLSVRYGERTVLNNVSFTWMPGSG
jgi:ABC-type cobalamin/Fe3+-siderophores transport system ATPase subunit